MDWSSEMRTVVSKAAARAAYPAVWGPAVIVSGGASAIMSLGMLRIASTLTPSDIPSASGGLAFVGLLSFFALPAIMSGLWTVTRAAVVEGEADWSDFWSGMGVFYWRIVGLMLLSGLAMSAAILILRIPSPGQYRQGHFLYSAPAPLMLLYLVGQYFATSVIPAMVIEEEGALRSVGLGIAFGWRNPSILVPAVALDAAFSWVAQRAEALLMGLSPGGVALHPGKVAGYVAIALVGAAVAAFFRVLYMEIYKSRRVVALPQMPAEPGNQVPAEDSPGPEGEGEPTNPK